MQTEPPDDAAELVAPAKPPCDRQLTPVATSKGPVPSWRDSPRHPLNWASGKKWRIALTIACTGFLSTMCSSVFVPATTYLEDEYNASRELVTLTTSLYVAGLGAGPFVFAPISELYGRHRSYVLSMIGFTAINLGCCFADSLPGLIVLRFFSGFFGSSGPGLGVATISDLFIPQERGRPIAVYAIGPMLGPVIGSLVGNYLVLLDWRWPFRVMTILIGLNTLAIVLCMEETYSSVLERKFRAELGGASGPSTGYAKEVFVRTFTRPPRMLLNPVCALFATYYAYIYGIIYVFLVSLPLLFGRHDPPTGIYSYNWPAETVGLCYLGLGIGFLASALTAAIYQDRIYRYMSTRHQNEGQPEYRLIVTQLGMVIFPAGLLLWGWTAEAQVYWIVPLSGTAIFGYGLMAAFNSIQAFIVDAYAPYSAAAMAAATFMRSITGAVLPIFAPNLFLNLSYGKGATLLACVSLPAVPVPVLLLMSGGRLREKWKFKA